MLDRQVATMSLDDDDDAGEEDDDDDNGEMNADEYDTIDIEGVDYLEHNDTAKIYNTKGECVGRWNADCSGIVWTNDKFKQEHEAKRGKSFFHLHLLFDFLC